MSGTQERRGGAPVQYGGVLVADLGHFLSLPEDASGSARRLAQHLGDIGRAGTAGDVGDPWVSALPCRRRPAHRRCPGRMTIAIVWAEAAAPIRWWHLIRPAPPPVERCRRRRRGHRQRRDRRRVTRAGVARPRLSAAGVWQRAHPGGGVLLAGADDLEELIEFVAAEANHEPNRRRQHRLDAAFYALIESAQTLYG